MTLHVLVAAAREAIRARLEGRAAVPPAGPRGPAVPMFVTIRLEGELRGCMGALQPRADDLVAEAMERALVAAFEDPRFPPLGPHELDRVALEITLLGPLETVTDARELDPARYGVEVSDGSGKSAILLPALEGLDTSGAQVAAARRKAGIPEGAPVTIRRFAVTRVADA